MRSKNFFDLFVILASIASFIFFSVLFLSVRCEPDDMIISLEFRNNSFFDVFANRYAIYSFRPVYELFAFFTTGFTSETGNYLWSIPLFYFLLYTFFVFVIYKLLREVFHINMRTHKERALLVCVANLFVTSIYFFTTERIEIFGWLSASMIHLTPVVFTFFCAWIIFKREKSSFAFIWLFIGAFFVAGGAQHVAPTVLAGGASTGIIFLMQRKDGLKKVLSGASAKRVVFFLTVLLAFFLAFITNPGADLHYNAAVEYVNANPQEYHFDLKETILLFFKRHKVFGIILLATSLLSLQKFFSIKFIELKVKPFFIFLVCSLVIVVWAGMKAYNSLSVGRIWFVFDVTLWLFLLVSLVRIFRNGSSAAFFKTFATFSCAILVFHAVRHVPALIRYSSYYDKVVSQLKATKQDETLAVEKFPDADLTAQVILSEDTENGDNKLFCTFYQSGAKLSVKK